MIYVEPAPAPVSAAARQKLQEARQAARTGLKVFADWLKRCGAPAAEVEALRASYRAIPDPKA